MGLRTIIKLYFRLIILIIFSTFLAYDYYYSTNMTNYLINYKLFNVVSIIHILWLFLVLEMIVLIIPKFNRYSYSGKHLLKHCLPETNYNQEKLDQFTNQNKKRALNSAIFWILLNAPFALLFFLGYLHPRFFYWLFFLYYFFDTVCINIFCIFHVYIVRNKCCNECRIYNWSNFMYCTPLLFMPNFWNYSLIFLSIIILIQWEVSVHFHPERFSSISNRTLQCKHCPHKCRYNTNKHTLIQWINKIGQSLYNKFKHAKS
ncbi:hypothetical protein KHQ81_13385 [Mycoplasmatota bacterium]|nr:hypothetical protein KHQ81_13385 [Mycoplasmatota bacterium]